MRVFTNCLSPKVGSPILNDIGSWGALDLTGSPVMQTMQPLSSRFQVFVQSCQTLPGKYIYNADECGLMYEMALDSTIAKHALPERKNQKNWFAVLVFWNAAGTEKYSLLLIGHAQRPRPFKKKSRYEYGLDYVSNSRAWMTSDLFFSWLHGFDMFIGKWKERMVALLIDNCSAHGSRDTLPDLQRTTD